jgi:simple sugar transport system ATP-binding protein
MLGVTKTFPGVKALDDVALQLRAGEVHALLGENGAGKSTLIKILTGALKRDKGIVRLDGAEIEVGTTAEAQAHGISTVYQEVNLIPTLSVAQNLTLGRQPRRFGIVDWKKSRELARQRLARLKLDIDTERSLGSYSVAVQQLIAIARALEENTRVLVLDEPTASLDAEETALLFQIVRDLKAHGIAIVFITHFIDQVYQIADRISVLRNGKMVGTAPASELPRLKLISMMIGRELEGIGKRPTAQYSDPTSTPVLEAEGLGSKRIIAPFDLTLRAGEVVGLAGLLGSGRTETAKVLFGAIRPDSGTLKIDGKPTAHLTPRQSLGHGIAFCPEDRKAEGLIGELSVRENLMLSLQAKRGWLNRLSRKEQEKLADEMIKALAIATPDAEKPVGQLSGGNQQKVILARSLVSKPEALLLDEPTRGIDVGAHAEIVTLIRRLCSEGLALLVASSEFDELVSVSDRVAVLRDRNKVGEISGDEITRENIINTIAHR